MSAPAVALQPFNVEETERLQQGDELRCSACYKADPKYVCSVCGRLLCAHCVRNPRFFTVSLPAAELPKDLKPASRPVYCSEHRRATVSFAAIGICSSLAVGLFGMIVSSGTLALFGLALGVGLLLTRSRLDRISARRRRGNSSVFGALARYELEIEEKLELDLNLACDAPYAVKGEPRGKLSLAVILDDGDKQRFGKGGGSSTFTELHAGFFKARGTRTRFNEELSMAGFATPIRGPIPAEFLNLIPGRRIGARLSYSIVAPEDPDGRSRWWGIPILVVPDKGASEFNPRLWGLTFCLQTEEVRKCVITRLTLDLPPELVSVEYTDGVFESEQSRIVWRDLPISPQSPARIQVEFGEPIHCVDRLIARYEIEMEGIALSDLRIPLNYVWYPTGQKVESERFIVKQSTLVSGTISAATRLQPKRQEVIARHRISRPKCLLTVSLAHKLLSEFSNQGLYAKDINEAGPTLVLKSSDIWCRYWEVIGRYYIERQPYDVHIVLTGHDCEMGVSSDCDFRLELEIVVRNLAEHSLDTSEWEKVDSAALDLLSAAERVIHAEAV
jgi:hypothetical protein